MVKKVMLAPEQREKPRVGRDLLQSKVKMSGKDYLVRVVVDIDKSPAEVVTTYRTAKLTKYWRQQ